MGIIQAPTGAQVFNHVIPGIAGVQGSPINFAIPLTEQGRQRLIMVEALGMLTGAPEDIQTRLRDERKALASYVNWFQNTYGQDALKFSMSGGDEARRVKGKLEPLMVASDAAKLAGALESPNRLRSPARDRFACEVLRLVRGQIRAAFKQGSAGGQQAEDVEPDNLNHEAAIDALKKLFDEREAVQSAPAPFVEAMAGIEKELGRVAERGKPGASLHPRVYNRHGDSRWTASVRWPLVQRIENKTVSEEVDAYSLLVYLHFDEILASIKDELAANYKHHTIALTAEDRRLQLAELGKQILRNQRIVCHVAMEEAAKSGTYPAWFSTDFVTAEAVLGVRWTDTRKKSGGFGSLFQG